MRFKIPSNAIGYSSDVVEFTPKAIETLFDHKQLPVTLPEAGGQLFGRFLSGIIEITFVTTPDTSDKRTRYSFSRNRAIEQEEINQAFKKGLHYIGDWHTHPQSNPTPSPTDISNAKMLYCKSRSELKDFLMVIVGTKAVFDGIYVAVVNGNRVQQLRAIRNNNTQSLKPFSQ